MTALYWNAPSSPAYYTDAANWRIGSTSGTVSSVAPTSSDDVYFSSSSSLVGCTFDSNVTVRSFTADDPNGTFTLGPSYINAFEISVSAGFDITNAGSSQKSIFSQWSMLNDAPVVKLLTTPGAGATATVYIGNNQIGAIEVNGSTTGTTDFYSSAGPSIYTFKCYSLQINAGTGRFVVASCNGAVIGYPSNTSTTRIAIATNASASRTLDAQFPSSKPIVLYGGISATASAYSTPYLLTWATDTQIHVRGAASSTTLTVGTIPSGPGIPVAPRQLPNVYNYLGEDGSGGSVGSGGVLKINATAVGLSNACPISVRSITSTPAGSVSGFFTRGVEIVSDPSTIRYTYISIPGSGSSPGFNVQGDSTHQATLSGTSGALAQGYLAYTNPSSLNIQTYYTTITNVNAVSTGGQYIAYTDEGNIDGGNNTGWVFTQAQSGFLAFFL